MLPLRTIATCVLLGMFSSMPVVAEEELYVRVIDVGAGESCVIKTPDNKFMIYDAGHWNGNGAAAMAGIRSVIPPGSAIELLVLSHCDADHHGAVPSICQEYRVKRVLRDGFRCPTNTWKNSNAAVLREVETDDCEDINLANEEIAPGHSFALGAATVTFVCGFHDLPEDWPNLSSSEARNARSVVVRLGYADRSILFCGDTVGRHIGDDDNVCIAAERFMVDNADDVRLRSDVIVAPHHGADNGSSVEFIAAVDPDYVIFAAGHDHEHPWASTAERYLRHGVDEQRIFRTDRGDNEGGSEWQSNQSSIPDPTRDDDVEMIISSTGDLRVQYRQPTIQPFAFRAPLRMAPQPAPQLNDRGLPKWQPRARPYAAALPPCPQMIRRLCVSFPRCYRVRWCR